MAAHSGNGPLPPRSETDHLVPFAAAVAVFLVGTLASIVLINDLEDGELWILGIPQFLACLAVGWLIRPWGWTAPAFALAPSLLAAPFGIPGVAESPDIAFIELLAAPISLAFIVVGIGARIAIERRRGDHRRPSGPRSGRSVD